MSPEGPHEKKTSWPNFGVLSRYIAQRNQVSWNQFKLSHFADCRTHVRRWTVEGFG